MKPINFKFIRKQIFSGLLTFLIISSLNSCTRKIIFQNSSVVPAAQGFVKVNTDDNNNYTIQVDITNLAEVSRLQPPKLTYVVWIETDQEILVNIGQINSSKKLSASFETVSSFKPIKVFITAENNASTQYPDTQIILSTNNFRIN